MEFDDDENCDGGVVPKFGAIFMSNIATKRECFKRKIFGLPLAFANFVKQVKSGMILFLFEFEKRELYGVFQATSDGTMNLIPHAFTSSGKQFPAQVQIAPIWSCGPLPEVVFRDAIRDNYYSPKKFHFGLSENQVRVLLQLFYSRRLNNRMPRRQIADETTREAGNKRHKTDDRSMVTGTSEQETRHYIRTNDYLVTSDCSEHPRNSFYKERQVADNRFLMNERVEKKICVNFDIGHVMQNEKSYGIDKLLAEDKMTLYSAGNEHGMDSAIRPVNSGDHLAEPIETRPTDDSRFFVNSGFSTEYVGNSLVGIVGADREPHNRFKNDHDMGGGSEPDILTVFPRYSTLSQDDIVADDFRFSKDDRVENVCDLESCIKPNFVSDVKKAPCRSEQNILMNSTESSHHEHLYANLIKPNLESDCFPFHDQLQYSSASHLPNRSKFLTQTSIVSNDALNRRTVPYDPEFPDMKYQCSSHILDLAQDLSSDQVRDNNFLSLSTSKSVTHERAPGSLYSQSSVDRASVFSRLSVAPRKHKKEDDNGINDERDMLASVDEIMDSLHQAPRKHKKEDDNGIHDECDMLASVDEIMDSLHQAHNHWMKGKTYRANNRFVYVRCKEESKFPNPLQFEQPVVTEEMAVDVNRFIEEDSDIVLKETRVVDFKRRSKKNKNLDEKVTIVSTGTTTGMIPKTSVDATGEYLVVKAGKSRKLIRPDFRKKECPHESNNGNSISCRSPCDDTFHRNDSTSCEDACKSRDISDMPAKNTRSTTSEDNTSSRETVECIASLNSEKNCGASNIHQEGLVDKELLQDTEIVNEISQVPQSEMIRNVKNDLVIENQVKLSIKDLVSSLSSSHSAQDSLSLLTEDTAIYGNLKGKEENEETYQVGSGANNLEKKSSLKNGLEIENQVKLSNQDLVSSLMSRSSAQEAPSFSTEVTAVPRNLEDKEENADLNYQVSDGNNTLE